MKKNSLSVCVRVKDTMFFRPVLKDDAFSIEGRLIVKSECVCLSVCARSNVKGQKTYIIKVYRNLVFYTECRSEGGRSSPSEGERTHFRNQENIPQKSIKISISPPIEGLIVDDSLFQEPKDIFKVRKIKPNKRTSKFSSPKERFLKLTDQNEVQKKFVELHG